MSPCQGPWGGGYGGDSYRKDYLEAERRLCEARWIMLRLIDGADPKTLHDLIAKHRAEQLEHRRGDKQHVLDAIAQTLRRLDDDEKEVTKRGGTVSERMASQRQRLLAERARIKAITDAQLLRDYWGNETRLSSDVVDHT